MDSQALIPEGWRITTLGEVGTYLNGRAFKKSEWSTEGRPIIRIQDLTGSNTNPNFFEGELDDRYVVRPGDFLISWSATLGAYIWDGPEAVLNQHIFKVESHLNRRFHYHLVRDRIAELQRSAHGSGMVHVTKGIFDSIRVAVPVDIAEQERIALKLDAAELSRASASKHLALARQAIDEFRESVLLAACAGRLTVGWREGQIEPGESIHALVERARRRRESESSSYRDPEPNIHADLGKLPSEWTQGCLGDMTRQLKYGTSKKSAYDVDGTPVLRIPNVRRGAIDLTDMKFSVLDERELTQLQLRIDDLLLVRSNGSPQLVGKTTRVDEGAVGMAYAGYLIRLRVDEDFLDARFLELVLRSRRLRTQIEMPLRSTSGVHNINTQEVKGLVIPIPPLNEQQEIVQRVLKMMRLADEVSQRIDAAMQLVERSGASVLARVFKVEPPV